MSMLFQPPSSFLTIVFKTKNYRKKFAIAEREQPIDPSLVSLHFSNIVLRKRRKNLAREKRNFVECGSIRNPLRLDQERAP